MFVFLEYDPRTMAMCDFIKAAMVFSEVLLKQSSVQICGATIIVDLNDFGITHMKYIPLTETKNLLMNFQVSTT